MGNYTVDEHYISQFIIRNFTDVNGKVRVINKNKEPIEPYSSLPSSLFYSCNLYETKNASHIPLETDCGLNEPSMVMLEQIRTIDKAEELISYIGRIDDGETIAKIKDGIRYQFQLMRKRKPIRTGYILSLCPKCRAEFFSVPENILRRVDPLQVEKEPCDKCQVGYGYDYLITKRTKRSNNGGGGLDV